MLIYQLPKFVFTLKLTYIHHNNIGGEIESNMTFLCVFRCGFYCSSVFFSVYVYGNSKIHVKTFALSIFHVLSCY